MITWAKAGSRVSSEGRTTTYYGLGTTLTIESRLRHIPHANGVGTWDHTTYFVMIGTEDLKERYSLKDAKEWAEEYWAATESEIKGEKE